MKIVLFCHSILSDWNHGNAHFLRGVTTELRARGHSVRTFEPVDAWSAQNLVAERGTRALEEVREVYPALDVVRYRTESLDLEEALDGADLCWVHEWNPPELVNAIGAYRARGGRFRALFHDTHHRSVTDPRAMRRYDLSGYDGVLAFGEAIRQRYLAEGWAARVWTWHEAADTRVFKPLPDRSPEGDLVWIGNWGDDERTAELHEFLLSPVGDLRLAANVYGVRYPNTAKSALRRHGITYGGSLPNYRAPELFARHRVTVHVPRRPYAAALPGIPTIRVFEALACGIPLVSAPWEDAEGLFRPGRDFLFVRNGNEMRERLRDLLHDRTLGNALAESGRRTIASRHTCAHRASELLDICASLGLRATDETPQGVQRSIPTAMEQG